MLLPTSRSPLQAMGNLYSHLHPDGRSLCCDFVGQFHATSRGVNLFMRGHTSGVPSAILSLLSLFLLGGVFVKEASKCPMRLFPAKFLEEDRQNNKITKDMHCLEESKDIKKPTTKGRTRSFACKSSLHCYRVELLCQGLRSWPAKSL